MPAVLDLQMSTGRKIGLLIIFMSVSSSPRMHSGFSHCQDATSSSAAIASTSGHLNVRHFSLGDGQTGSIADLISLREESHNVAAGSIECLFMSIILDQLFPCFNFQPFVSILSDDAVADSSPPLPRELIENWDGLEPKQYQLLHV
jgi:hypothetical protein